MRLLPLLHRRPRRHFALLDASDCCQMLLTASQRPAAAAWREVTHAHLGWIGQRLPNDALVG